MRGSYRIRNGVIVLDNFNHVKSIDSEKICCIGPELKKLYSNIKVEDWVVSYLVKSKLVPVSNDENIEEVFIIDCEALLEIEYKILIGLYMKLPKPTTTTGTPAMMSAYESIGKGVDRVNKGLDLSNEFLFTLSSKLKLICEGYRLIEGSIPMEEYRKPILQKQKSKRKH